MDLKMYLTRLQRAPWVRRSVLMAVGIVALGWSGILIGDTPAASLPDDRVRGNPRAPVTIIEYSDFTCGYCVKFFRETWPLLQAKYVDAGKVRFLYRDYPRADQGVGVEAALAARCAGEQGRYWAMHDRLFAQGPRLDASQFSDYAKAIGLKPDRYNACVRQETYLESIFNDRQEANRWGFRGTPGFVLFLTNDMSGRVETPVTVPGAFPFNVFQEQIERLLRRAGATEAPPQSSLLTKPSLLAASWSPGLTDPPPR
ncbi:MAG: DsbA family protein [Nitrospiraceae bacterium]